MKSKRTGEVPISIILNRDTFGKIRFENNFWGVGLIAGIQPAWYFSRCFSLFSDLGFSLLWGEFKRKKKTSYFSTQIGTGSPPLNSGIVLDYSYQSKSKFYSMQAILDLALGLSWENTWCCDRYKTAFTAGWEHHIWLEHNHRYTSVQDTLGRPNETNHTIAFGGFVLRARFEF